MSHNGNCEYKLENTIYNEENKKKIAELEQQAEEEEQKGEE